MATADPAPGAGSTAAPTVARYGSWRSSIPIDQLVSGVVRLGQLQADGETLYWLEGRPEEGGRAALVRRAANGSIEDVSPAGVNVRDRVHEYGGGAYAVDAGDIVFSNWADGRLWLIAAGSGAEDARAITPEGAFRYADLAFDRPRGRVIAVREDHSGPGEAVNTIVAIPLDGSAAVEVLVEGSSFYSSPRLDPTRPRLAWLSWDHPNLPWDGTELWVAPLDVAGRATAPERVAGSPSEWTAQPRWSPDGVLHFVNERTGWMALYRRIEGRDELLTPIEAEFAYPDWQFGFSNYTFMGPGRIVACGRAGGRDSLWSIEAAGGGVPARLTSIDVPFTEMDELQTVGDRVALIGSGPNDFSSVVTLDPATGAPTILRRATETILDPVDVSAAQPIEFKTAGGRTAHALFYPPRNGRYRAPVGELPPLIVTSHGGPTSAASSALSVTTQLFTSRGLAVLDVDYGGSTGYGREYRKRLEGTWGVTDVEDCANGAIALAERGLIDRDRIAIRGGSASGYTTLCAVTFRDEFRAGVSYFGIGDLETFAAETHKFESRYVDRLVGPYPEAAELYRERSPLNFTDRISCPVLILQGLDDRIVPPVQAEQIVASLAANGIPHAYLAYEGEDHGFRKAENIIGSFAAELSFYGQIFGFEPADRIEPLVLTR